MKLCFNLSIFQADKCIRVELFSHQTNNKVFLKMGKIMTQPHTIKAICKQLQEFNHKQRMRQKITLNLLNWSEKN